MDHRVLFKIGKTNSLDTSAKMKAMKNRRADKRREHFAISRNIAVDQDEDEDEKENDNNRSNLNGSRKRRQSAGNVLDKRQQYLLRYLAYKEKKNEALAAIKKNIKPPFVSAVPRNRIISGRISKHSARSQSHKPLNKTKQLLKQELNQTDMDQCFKFNLDGSRFTSTNFKPRRDSVVKAIESAESNKENCVDDTMNGITPIRCITPNKDTIIEETLKPVGYLSPFVSTARGKGSVRKEKKNVELAERLNTANYFKKQLEQQIVRLLDLCNKWEQYLTDTPELQSEYVDLVHVSIGQTKLLVSKKFEQFRSLINKYEANVVEGGKPIFPEDLEGFWSMVYIQVDNCDNRFNKLDTLKSNNWIDPDCIPLKAKSSKEKLINIVNKNRANKLVKLETKENTITNDVVIEQKVPKCKGKSKLLELINQQRLQKKLAMQAGQESVVNSIIKSNKKSISGDSPRIYLKNMTSERLLNEPKSSGILKTPGSIRKRKSVLFAFKEDSEKRNSNSDKIFDVDKLTPKPKIVHTPHHRKSGRNVLVVNDNNTTDSPSNYSKLEPRKISFIDDYNQITPTQNTKKKLRRSVRVMSQGNSIMEE